MLQRDSERLARAQIKQLNRVHCSVALAVAPATVPAKGFADNSPQHVLACR
jgi:hypothetical protein